MSNIKAKVGRGEVEGIDHVNLRAGKHLFEVQAQRLFNGCFGGAGLGTGGSSTEINKTGPENLAIQHRGDRERIREWNR